MILIFEYQKGMWRSYRHIYSIFHCLGCRNAWEGDYNVFNSHFVAGSKILHLRLDRGIQCGRYSLLVDALL